MIAQTLNREFLLAVAEATRLEAESEAAARSGGRRRRRGAPTRLDEVETVELQATAEALVEALAHPDGSDEAEAVEPEPEGVRPRDDLAFIPRDPLLSIVQSVMEEYFEEVEPDKIDDRPLFDEARRGGVPAVTDRQLSHVPLKRGSGGRRLWKAFEVGNPRLKLLVSDPRWVVSGVAMAYRSLRGRAPFVDRPARVQISDRARLLLVGDWGSGLPRAQKVARRMQEELGRWDGEQHVIHLGDVYYSGTKREYERRFLRYWPVGSSDDGIGSFALNGNHDMYTGGHAYYGTCLADPRFHRQLGCSFFALENEHWQFLGLDSSYEDKGLHGPQGEWARQLVQGRGDRQRTCLLSHHQLFSAHEGGAKPMRSKLAPVLEQGIDAWFWGHEHRCIQYTEDVQHGGRVGFSSCVGHGGVPEYLVMRDEDTRPAPWAYEYTKNAGSELEPWETFGFAVVELQADDMRVRYIDEDGIEHYKVDGVLGARA